MRGGERRQFSALPSEYLTPARAFVSAHVQHPYLCASPARWPPRRRQIFSSPRSFSPCSFSSAFVSAERKDITRRFRRGGACLLCRAHPAHRRRVAGAEAMRLLDPHTFHSPAQPIISIIRRFSMRCSRRLGPRLEGHPQALLAHRLIDVALRRSALPRCSASGLPRVSRATSSTPTPCRSPAFRSWCRSPAPSTTTISLFSAAPWPRSASGKLSRPTATDGLRSRSSAWSPRLGEADRLLLTGADGGRRRCLSAVAQAIAVDLLVPIAARVRARRRALSRIHPALRQPDAGDAGAARADRTTARAPPAGPICRANPFPPISVYFVVAFVADWMPTLGARSALQLRHARHSGGGARLRARGTRAVAAPAVAAAGNRARRRRASPERSRSPRPSRSMSPTATAAISRPAG